MAVKTKGKIAELYAEDMNIVKKVMSETHFHTDVKNLALHLASKGIIKDPNRLYGKIENYIAQAIILYKLNE